MVAVSPEAIANAKVSLRNCRQNYLDKQKALIWEHKSKPCADCGQRFPHYVMDFDHVVGEKKFNINRYAGHSYDSLKEEIEKCDVVCANCHRIRSYKREDHINETNNHAWKRSKHNYPRG